MAVRLKVELEVIKSKRSIEVVAVANAGFESDEPEVLIPLRLARKLKIKLKDIPKETYKSPVGLARMCRIDKCLKVRLMEKEVEAAVVISEIEDEVILNDRAISMLEIAIEDAGEGLWRFRNEPVTNLRKSQPLQKW